MGSKARPKIIKCVINSSEPISLSGIQRECEIKSYAGVHREVQLLKEANVFSVDTSGQGHLVSICDSDIAKRVVELLKSYS